MPPVCTKISIWTPKYSTAVLLSDRGVCSLPSLFLGSLLQLAVSRGSRCCEHLAPLGPDRHQRQQKKSRATLSRYFSNFETPQWFHTGGAGTWAGCSAPALAILKHPFLSIHCAVPHLPASSPTFKVVGVPSQNRSTKNDEEWLAKVLALPGFLKTAGDFSFPFNKVRCRNITQFFSPR